MKTVQDLWEDFLKEVFFGDLSENSDQFKSSKKVFYSAIYRFLTYARDEISLLDEKNGIAQFEKMYNEIVSFFREEIKNFKKEHPFSNDNKNPKGLSREAKE